MKWFTPKKKKYNVRKAVFKLMKEDGIMSIEITGKLHEKKFLFFKWYVPELVNPASVIAKWGQDHFVKTESREFININQFTRVTYSTENHFIER